MCETPLKRRHGIIAVMDLRLSWESQPRCSATLEDGTELVVRVLRPTDVDELRRWFRTVSDESRYQRFHTHVADLSDEQWRYLTNVDGYDHVALIGTIDDRVVAVARLIILAGEAELAFLVSDSFQRRGIGSALRDALVDLAQIRGARRLCAHVLPGNVAIRRLLTVPSLHLVADRGDVLELVLTER